MSGAFIYCGPPLYALIDGQGVVVEYPIDPADPQAEGVVQVEPTAPPAAEVGETVSEGVPALVEGTWRQTWVAASASPEVVAERTDALKAELVRQIDAERDRRQAIDFAHDFGAITALDDLGNSAPAGVRSLQCSPTDIDNWKAVYSRAARLEAKGLGAATLPIRCEDNWNVQTSATQVLDVLDLLFDRNAGLLFYGGGLKTEVRNAADAATALAVVAGATWPS